MSKTLTITLIVFSIVWLLILFRYIRNGKLSIKYSMIWFLMAIILFLVGITPKSMAFIAGKFGFLTTSNLVIGIILTLLLVITLILTMIVTNQKTQINNLIQEVSTLKMKK